MGDEPGAWLKPRVKSDVPASPTVRAAADVPRSGPLGEVQTKKQALTLLSVLLFVVFATAWRVMHPGCLTSPEAARTEELFAKPLRLEREVQKLQARIKQLEAEVAEKETQLKVDPLTILPDRTAPAVAATSSTEVADRPGVLHAHITLDRLPLVSDAINWAERPKTTPSFTDLYAAVQGDQWTPDKNLFLTFPNVYKMHSHFDYPHSSMWLEGDKVMAKVKEELALMGREIKFVAEAGSMHGGSAIRMAMELDKMGLTTVPILCIDPWTGDLNMWLNRIVWEHLGVRDGRATTYDQFLLNVRDSIASGRISPTHVVPFPVTSIVGARWLQATGYTPNLIYLDSAHEIDETYYELSLYWRLLEPGGILMGDDLGWEAVRHDVTRWAKDMDLEIKMFGVYYNWYIIKPLGYKPPV